MHPSLFSKFKRVTAQVYQYLVQPERITHQHIIKLFVNFCYQLQALVFGPVRQRILDLLYSICYREIYSFQLQFACLYFRKVEHIVDYMEQYIR